MSTYDELLGTVSRIAGAAIEWDMRDRGWWKGDDGWYSDSTLSPTSTYVLDWTGMYVRVVGEDGLSSHSDEFAATADTDFRAVWRGWYERVNEVFRPFLGLPDPAGFQPAIDAVDNAMSVLTVNTTVDGGGIGEPAELDTANEDLDSSLVSFCGEIIAMSGAMDTFAIAYSNRVPGVIRGQLAILGILGCNLSAEQELFRRLRVDIATTADDVLAVMADQNSGGAAGALTLLGAALAGASLFVTGGTSAVLIANAGTVVGILSAFVPEDEAPTPAQERLGGGDPMEVHENTVKYLDDIKKAVADEEDIVRRSLSGARGVVTGAQVDEFDLSQRPALLDVPDAQLIDVNPESLAFLGGVIAPYIADNLQVARQEAAGAPGVAAWTRNAEIGLGPTGPYAEWDDLYDTYVDVAVGTRRTLDDVGQKLVDVAGNYVAVDEVVAQRQRELQGFLDVPELD